MDRPLNDRVESMILLWNDYYRGDIDRLYHIKKIGLVSLYPIAFSIIFRQLFHVPIINEFH